MKNLHNRPFSTWSVKRGPSNAFLRKKKLYAKHILILCVLGLRGQGKEHKIINSWHRSTLLEKKTADAVVTKNETKWRLVGKRHTHTHNTWMRVEM